MERYIKDNNPRRNNDNLYRAIVAVCVLIIIGLLLIIIFSLKKSGESNYPEPIDSSYEEESRPTITIQEEAKPEPKAEEVKTLSLTPIVKSIIKDRNEVNSCHFLRPVLENYGFKEATNIDKLKDYYDVTCYSRVFSLHCSVRYYPEEDSEFDVGSDLLAQPHNDSAYIADIIMAPDATVVEFNLYSYGEANLKNWLNELKQLGFRVEDHPVFQQTSQWEMVDNQGLYLTLTKTGDRYGTVILTYLINNDYENLP